MAQGLGGDCATPPPNEAQKALLRLLGVCLETVASGKGKDRLQGVGEEICVASVET